jgi:hypothetical protein
MTDFVLMERAGRILFAAEIAGSKSHACRAHMRGESFHARHCHL